MQVNPELESKSIDRETLPSAVFDFIDSISSKIDTVGTETLDSEVILSLLEEFTSNFYRLEELSPNDIKSRARLLANLIISGIVGKNSADKGSGEIVDKTIISKFRTAIVLQATFGEYYDIAEYFAISASLGYGNEFLAAASDVSDLAIYRDSDNGNYDVEHPLIDSGIIKTSSVYGESENSLGNFNRKIDLVSVFGPSILRSMNISTSDDLSAICEVTCSKPMTGLFDSDVQSKSLFSKILKKISIYANRPIESQSYPESFDSYLADLINRSPDSARFAMMIIFGEKISKKEIEIYLSEFTTKIISAQDIKKLRGKERAIIYLAELAQEAILEIISGQIDKPKTVPDAIWRIIEAVGGKRQSADDIWELESTEYVLNLIKPYCEFKGNNHFIDSDKTLDGTPYECLSLISAADHNGAYVNYVDEQKSNPNHLVYRILNNNGIVAALSEYADYVEEFNLPKPDLIIIGGHGNMRTVRTGINGKEAGFNINIENSTLPEINAQLKRLGNPKLLLVSCDTGHFMPIEDINVAEHLSANLGSIILAPTKKAYDVKIIDGVAYFKYMYDDDEQKYLEYPGDEYWLEAREINNSREVLVT